MYKVNIIGNFGSGEQLDGQTIKTQELMEGIIDEYGSPSVNSINTYNWSSKKFKLFFDIIKKFRKSENTIIIPAHNGLKVFLPLIWFLSIFFDKKIHYVVIGGWLKNMVDKKPLLKYILKKYNYIFVETNFMKDELAEINIHNVKVLKNFRDRTEFKNSIILNKNHKSQKDVFKVCTFSRVMKEKGISDAIKIIKKINNESDITVEFDIYGRIESTYKSEFLNMIIGDENIRYKGTANHKESQTIIMQYDLLMFPTRFKTEGIPGTLIDSLYAGVPILASSWNSSRELINPQIGFLYEIDNLIDFENKLKGIVSEREILFRMKQNCVIESEKYNRKKVLEEDLIPYL